MDNLYRPSKKVTIGNIELTYIEAGSSQMGIVVEMIRLGLKDTILSASQQVKLTKDQIFEKCLKSMAGLLNDTSSNIGQIKQANAIAQILAGVETARLFHLLIYECFPEITAPHKLTDEAKMELFMILFSAMVDNIANTSKTLQSLI